MCVYKRIFFGGGGTKKTKKRKNCIRFRYVVTSQKNILGGSTIPEYGLETKTKNMAMKSEAEHIANRNYHK